MRKCFSHFGQTFKFSSRSFFQMIWRQFSHFTHKPSVRTVFLPELSKSPDSRLNQVISQLRVASTGYRAKSEPFCSVQDTHSSILNPSLRHHTFLVSVFHLTHFGHRIGGLDNCGVSVPSRQDDVNHFRLLLQTLNHFGWVQHAITDRIVNLIQHHQIPLARLDRLLPCSPRLFHHLHIFRIRLLRAHLHKAPPHLFHHKLIPKGLDSVQLAVVPGAFQELQHQDFHALPYRAQSCPHGRSRLPLSWPGVYDDQTTTHVVHDLLRMIDSTRKPQYRLGTALCIVRTDPLKIRIFLGTPASKLAYTGAS